MESIQNSEKIQKPEKKTRNTSKIWNFSGKSRRSDNTAREPGWWAIKSI